MIFIAAGEESLKSKLMQPITVSWTKGPLIEVH